MISGHAKLQLVDVKSGERKEIDLSAGQRVTIYPECAHKFIAITETHVIEYYETSFDLTDDIQFKGFKGGDPC